MEKGIVTNKSSNLGKRSLWVQDHISQIGKCVQVHQIGYKSYIDEKKER